MREPQLKYKNYLLGRPVVFGDKHQIEAEKSFTEPFQLHPSRVHGVKAQWLCIRCNTGNRFKTVYLGSEERWVTVTPWINRCTCCGQGMLLYKDSSEDGDGDNYYEEEDFWNGGRHVTFYYRRFLRVNEEVDELKFIDEEDSWKFYEHFNLVAPNARAKNLNLK